MEPNDISKRPIVCKKWYKGAVMYKNFRLYAQPSFESGAARLVDLGGVFDKYNKSDSERQADTRALGSDWATVGADIEVAMEQTTKDLCESR
jgi:hypothetical protein